MSEHPPISFRLQRLLRVLGWGSWRWWRLTRAWQSHTVASTEGLVRSFRGEMFALRQATIDPRLTENQNEGRLFLTPGALRVGEPKPPAQISEDHWLRVAWDAIAPADDIQQGNRVAGLTVLVPRREWANVWHATVDVYNAYLASRFLGHDTATTRIVFADNDRHNPFQALWCKISRESLYWHELQEHTCEELAACPTNYCSPFNSCLGPAPPYLEEFSKALRPPDGQEENLVVMVSRAGAVQRNVENEEEVAEAIRLALPGTQVLLQRMEELDFHAQVALVSRASLLVGAHGAGLTHALYLPKHGALLEIFPGYLQAFRFHFRNICRWRSLPYSCWINWRHSAPPENQSVTLPAAQIAARAAKLWRRRASPRGVLESGSERH